MYLHVHDNMYARTRMMNTMQQLTVTAAGQYVAVAAGVVVVVTHLDLSSGELVTRVVVDTTTSSMSTTAVVAVLSPAACCSCC